ncbi:MAG TPA: BlaI/MecI/CopY family transcriptional regulator [Caulifigura sp.]|jgi:predicted transcriptional regulator|nr:BlaI/MecI/CopY family transcriptional regulator [Caulifigura sp.]
MKRSERPRLGPLEHAVMQVIWSRPATTAEDVRIALDGQHDVKDSTARTILRRLEAKGYIEHDVDGRTFVYRPKVEPQNLASQQVQGIIDKLCRGSVENLLVGMVDDNLITADKLRQLAERISKADDAEKGRTRGKK